MPRTLRSAVVWPVLLTLTLALELALASALTPTSAVAPATARTVATTSTNPSNPLDDGPWGVSRQKGEELVKAYDAASGTNRTLLARMANRPRANWFGHWFRTGEIRAGIRDYIARTQAGNPRVIVHLSIFRLFPRQESGRWIRLTTAEQSAYRAWVREAAAGIGNSRVAMVLEPDLAVAAYDSADPGVRVGLARYAAKVFGALRNTHVYIDASSADWLPVAKAKRMLQSAGVRYVRGFALGATHYAGLGAEVDYGTKVMQSLAWAGLPGKHFVVDTADNGRPFTWRWFYDTHDGMRFDNAPACRYRSSRRCITLGVPPTWRVGASAWPLTSAQRVQARKRVDGYLWFGRPWLYRQASPFLLDRALQVARTTPFQ